MKPEYRAWIRAYEETSGGRASTLGKCESASREMVEAFPELTQVRGHVLCPEPYGKRGHWWCETEDGTVIDPTAGQFTFGIFSYEEYVEGDEIRLGKCMNCGDEIWGSPERGRPSVCSDSCGEDLMLGMEEIAAKYGKRA